MSNKPLKYVLVPISTIGCGKTTVSVCLTKLFPEVFALVSNDDMSSAKQFFTKSKQALNIHPAVIMDKNNHQKIHRSAIFEAFEPVKELVDIKFIACNFICNNLDSARGKQLWDITTKRAIQRGDNHQKLKVGSGDGSHIYRIMRMFLNKLEPLDLNEDPDTKFDYVINLSLIEKPNDSSLTNVKIIIHELLMNFPELLKTIPTDETILRCYNEALEFKPVIREKKKKQAPSKVLKGRHTPTVKKS